MHPDRQHPISLVEQVCEFLTSDIINGKLKPGDSLKEETLINEFRISRSPIREALRILAGKGLVTIVPRKGAHVRRITEKDILDIFPVRSMLEGFAANLAAQRMTEREITRLSVAIEQMEKSAEEKDFTSFMKGHYEFHRTYIEASDNEILKEILENLLNKALWLHFSFRYLHKNYSFSVRKHKEILRCFIRRDKDRVDGLVRQHIGAGMQGFLSLIAKNRPE